MCKGISENPVQVLIASIVETTAFFCQGETLSSDGNCVAGMQLFLPFLPVTRELSADFPVDLCKSESFVALYLRQPVFGSDSQVEICLMSYPVRLKNRICVPRAHRLFSLSTLKDLECLLFRLLIFSWEN